MKIIDAHFHMFPDHPFASSLLREVGHENSLDYLKRYYAEHGITAGIIMGNDHLEADFHRYPEPFYYCIGLDDHATERHAQEDLPALVEEHLRRERCVGIKLYTGYSPRTVNDPFYDFAFSLAAKYHKPVAIHTGMTAGAGGMLKYSHPLMLDEAAVRHPDVDIVMCHFGNPFLSEAAAVLEKNDNVFCDLSGLIEGVKDWDSYFAAQAGYIGQLRTWMAYVENWDKFMFGTDLPAVNIANYIEFIRRLVPEAQHEKVFFENANRVYRLGL